MSDDVKPYTRDTLESLGEPPTTEEWPHVLRMVRALWDRCDALEASARATSGVPQPVTLVVDGESVTRYVKRPGTREELVALRLDCFNNPQHRTDHRCMVCDNGYVYAAVVKRPERGCPSCGVVGQNADCSNLWHDTGGDAQRKETTSSGRRTDSEAMP